MNNEKIENLLNLALNATEEEREKSAELDVGYDAADNTWEIIVKYNGNIKRLESLGEGITVEELTNEYAILNVPEPLIDLVANQIEVEYVEKPKNLFFSVLEGVRESCILPVAREPFSLTGRDVLVAVIDSGERVIIMSS